MRRGFVLTLAILILLPISAVLLYLGFRTEQNVAGEHAWNDTVARLRAAGEPTEFQALIPPAIPDSTNLGAIDLFKLDYDPATKEQGPIKLQTALHDLFDPQEPRFGSFLHGQPVDQAKLLEFLKKQHQHIFPAQPVPASPLAQIDDLCPALATLRDAAALRRDCRFDRDYQTDPPWNRLFSSTTMLIKLAKASNLHAVTALQTSAPDIALQDIEATLTLDAGLRKEPILISGLVAIGIFTIQEQAIWEGIEDHAWNDAQLADLQHQLASIDFLADGQLCLRGEALGFLAPTLDFLRKHQDSSAHLIDGMLTGSNGSKVGIGMLWSLSPAGWFDSAKAQGLSADFDAARALDPLARRVYPEKYAAARPAFGTVSQYEPPMMLVRVSAGPVTAAVTKFSLGQFRADAARIACMLERYRLAHGQLPASLNLLANYGPVPVDLCNGEAYHYTPRPDGTFLLYSVGWNLSDEGGKVVDRSDQPKTTDENQGDWVWPQPGHPGT